jgi:alkylhydroperoxidase family enzyme
MARLPFVQPADLPPAQQSLLSSGINLHKLLANSPAALSAFRAFTNFVRDGSSSVNRQETELAMAQIGYAVNNRYEYSHHVQIALEVGVPPEKVLAIADETAGRPSILSAREKAMLRAARDLATGLGVSAPAMDELEQHLTPKERIDIIVCIVAYCSTVRLLNSFDVDLETKYEQYLRDFPLRDA